MAQFFLRSKREEGVAPLYTKIRRNGMQMYVCSGIQVNIREWNKALKSISAMKRYEQSEEGAKVHDLQMKVMNAIDSLYAENKINNKEDKIIIEQTLSAIVNGTVEEIQQTVEATTAKSKSTVFGFYEYFLAGIADGTIRHNNSEYKPGTVVVWKSFGDNLREYCKKDISFDDIDKPFADKFTVYLIKKGFMVQTINKKVSCFRKLCNLAAMEGYNKNAASLRVWKDKTVKDDEKRAEIYLTDDEIEAMYALKLTGENELIRDIFLLGYFSCQRYSDYCILQEKNFITYNKEGHITLTQKKTGKTVEIPIYDDRVYELCEKLDKKENGLKFTENERKRFGKLNKMAKIRNGSPLWERNIHGEVVRPKYELVPVG